MGRGVEWDDWEVDAILKHLKYLYVQKTKNNDAIYPKVLEGCRIDYGCKWSRNSN